MTTAGSALQAWESIREARLLHPEPWSEDEYFTLGGPLSRVELVDGSLWLRPAPDKRHQRLVGLLAEALDDPAESAGFLLFPGVCLRLAAGRILQPDIVVADTDDEGIAVEAREAKLVVEVVSPRNAGTDRLFKPQLYAAAGIGWYLRVEQPKGSVELHLQKLAGDHYVPFTIATAGQVLTVEEPFLFQLDVDALSAARPKPRGAPDTSAH